jgi:four helix bundle protein
MLLHNLDNMPRFTEWKVRQRGHALVRNVCRVPAGFPVAGRYGLLSQLRRAVLSVPTNSAEGSRRTGQQEYARFLNTTEASLAKTGYQLMVSRDFACITPQQATVVFKDVAELARMLHGLRQTVGPTN